MSSRIDINANRPGNLASPGRVSIVENHLQILLFINQRYSAFMHSFISTHTLSTSLPSQMIDVTELVHDVVHQRQLSSGMVIVYVPHTTAAVTINENADPDVPHDILAKLQSLIPRRETYYRHGEGNSDAHVKTSLVGNSVLVLVEHGRLVLGRWQGIFLCEFDGPRERQLLVRLVDFDASSRTPASS